jgi:hypothetical protein
MKKIVRSIAQAFAYLFILLGFHSSKATSPETDRKAKVARQRVIMLDEHELSAYHSN